MIGIGVVGCGVISEAHIATIKKVKEGRLVAVCDTDLFKAKKMGEENQVDYYTDLKDMLRRDDLHLVCLCTPSSLHAEQAIQSAEMGKHILTEKPMATTLKIADKMIDICYKMNVKLGVIYQRRMIQPYLMIKEALKRNELGKMILGDCYLKYYRSPEYYQSASWRGTWKYDGGGCLINQGIHMIDILQWLMGPVYTIFGYVDTLARDIEVEDTAVATIRFKSGALGVIEGTTSIYTPIQERLELHGDRGSILIEGDEIRRWALLGKDGKEIEVQIPNVQEENPFLPEQSWMLGHFRLIKDMVDAILNNREPVINSEEGRKALEIILAIYHFSKTGKPVHL